MTSSPDVEAPNIETHVFTPGEDVPNNKLPLVLYRGALGSEGDLAVRCEEMFNAHGWPGPWRNGIYGHPPRRRLSRVSTPLEPIRAPQISAVPTKISDHRR